LYKVSDVAVLIFENACNVRSRLGKPLETWMHDYTRNRHPTSAASFTMHISHTILEASAAYR
jgi:hypothetical protein